MANNYLKASFTIAVTSGEADLIEQAFAASETLADLDEEADSRTNAYGELGDAFAAAFPPRDGDPFGSFLDLFVDPAYPTFDCDLQRLDTNQAGQAILLFSGDQFATDAVAHLLFATAKSALPFGFEFALDCDRLRPGEFGGGYVAITAQGVTFGHSAQQLDRAIGRALDEGADGFVLAIRNAEHGLSFWNNDKGFGRLSDASVFTEAEAARFDKPIADDEAEWLAMPAPLA